MTSITLIYNSGIVIVAVTIVLEQIEKKIESRIVDRSIGLPGISAEAQTNDRPSYRSAFLQSRCR